MKKVFSNESKFQAHVVKLAKTNGWLCYYTFISKGSPKGFPDLVLAHKSRGLAFAELKTERGKLTAEQEKWRDVLKAAGQRVFLWRPADLDDVWKFLCGKDRG